MFFVLDQPWIIAVKNTPAKRSRFHELDHPRGPPEQHLHGFFMEPRQSGMGGGGKIRSVAARPMVWWDRSCARTA
jgi:hypothetical protein